jgi:type I restriction enzyme M protein
MFEQAFRNIDESLRREAGCTTELDYTEQTSWLLFLKYLDGLEQDKADEAALERKKYEFILDKPYRWEEWAAPKTPGNANLPIGAPKNSAINHNKAKTGDDLRDFVNLKLFPYLHAFKQKASGPNTIEYKIGEIFGEIKNKIQSGYNLREIIDHIDELRFRSQTEKHELSHLYEAKIKNMGNAGRNGGEYYTPRPLIRAMVQVVAPKIGERIYDGACGSAGFLCESFEYLKTGNANLPIGVVNGTKNARPGNADLPIGGVGSNKKPAIQENDAPSLTTKDLRTLQERTFFGKEKKSLAYVIGIMNMILHGIEAPNIIHTNTLTENLADIQEKDRYEVVLANPPFGGKERPEVQQNFLIRTGETAFLFLQHFIKILKAGGRGGIVIKNTFLSNTDNASVSLRKMLLESCNLHAVLDCPGGTFQGAGVKTVVLFFEKGSKTRKIWFYQLDPGRNLGKTNPLNDEDLAEFAQLQKTFANSPKSWSIDAKSID